MKKSISFLMVSIAATCFAQTNKSTPKAEVQITPTSPQITISGAGSFIEYRHGMIVAHIEVSGLAPLSQHAIHIHEFGDCGNGGKNAGGHWNPTMDQHGHLQMKHANKNNHAHSGDLGNLLADEQGKALISMFTDQWCIDCNDSNKNILGKAIIIHEGQDDFVTQPTGGAGGRIGCGVIQITPPIGEENNP